MCIIKISSFSTVSHPHVRLCKRSSKLGYLCLCTTSLGTNMSIHVLVGYRQMTSCIRQRHTVPASRQQVAECLRVLDPSASDARRSSKLVCRLARTNLSVHIKKISIDFLIFDGFISLVFIYLPRLIMGMCICICVYI